MSAFVSWLVAVMVMLSPPDRDAKRAEKYGAETTMERLDRYREIAADLEGAVIEEAPIPQYTRAETAKLLLAISFYESSFAPDVDSGKCNETITDKPGKRCDGGRSVGLIQLHFARGQTTLLGRSFEELVGHRRVTFATGIEMLRRGVAHCERMARVRDPHGKKRTRTERTSAALAWYASGSCDSPRGAADAEKKLKLFGRLNQERSAVIFKVKFPAYEGPEPSPETVGVMSRL